jgi:hypothetical protein
MNTKFYKIYGIICFFPVWVFKSSLNIIELLALFFLLSAIPFYIHKLILRYFIKTQSNIIHIWLGLITFYCIDQNFGLWIFSQKFNFIFYTSPFIVAMYFSMAVILFLSLIFFLLKQNALKILFSFIMVIFVFNIFDSSKNFNNFPSADLSHNNQQTKNNSLEKKIVLIFDEMTGLNSVDDKVENSNDINEYILSYFLKNKFDIYINAFSLFKDTDKSLSSTFNFIKNKQDYKNIDQSKPLHFIKKSKNYFVVNDLTKNSFFDLDQNRNIVIQQSMFINFCNHPKVIICNQFNPFDKNLTFLNGFKDTKLTKYVSVYRNNGSILSRIIWRSLLHIRAVDTLLDPDGEKASIQFIFNQLFKNIQNNKDSTLFFSHILVPHIPYGFTKNCNYDGTKTTNFNSMSVDQKKTQHNLEKYCLVKYLDEFFNELKKISEFENFEIIIFSDHDSRIDQSQIKNNVILVHKKVRSKDSKIIKDKISINQFLYNLNSN